MKATRWEACTPGSVTSTRCRGKIVPILDFKLPSAARSKICGPRIVISMRYDETVGRIICFVEYNDAIRRGSSAEERRPRQKSRFHTKKREAAAPPA